MSINEGAQSNADGGKVPVAVAIEMTANWRQYLAQSGQKFDKKAFLIPISDLKEILENNPGAEGARAYIALKDAADPSTATLLLVPVVDGKDVVYVNGGEGDPNSDDDSSIYDYTKPCPPYCPDDSPLN
jgi:hypothetical protein